MKLSELFEICANRQNYVTVTQGARYEVDYKFIEDVGAKTLYIFFEPSDGRIDWRVNFAYWRRPYKDMKIEYRVHGGFLESWKLIRDIVCAKITEKNMEDENFKWKKIVTVGYSHGGALAALCHECVWFERPDIRDIIEGYSFDGPRVYAGLWIKPSLKKRWARFKVFRNHNDIVTHLPPVIFFFRHVGEVIKLGAGKDPGLIGAHYPDKIKKSLEEYENGL